MNNLILKFALIFLALFAAEGCGDPFKAPKAKMNWGSGIQAVNTGITAIRDYAKEKGSFPEAGVDLAKITSDTIPIFIAQSLEYGGNNSLTLDSPQRIILLKFAHPTPMTSGGSGFYCALLSGEILLLPEKDAQLGTICPKNIGSVVIPKP